MMKTVFVKLLFVFWVFMGACMSPRVYAPAVPATPLFEKKKDVYLDVYGNPFGTVGGTFGLALTNNIGAYAGIGAYFGDDYTWPFTPDYRLQTKTVNSTLGLGWYRNVVNSPGRRTECFLEFNRGGFEVFGSGHYYNNSTRIDQHGFIDGRYNQFSFLVNQSFKSYRSQLCVSFKAGTVHFFDYMKENDDPIHDVMIKLRNDRLFYDTNLAFTYILGRRAVKFKSQLLLNYGQTPLSVEKVSPGFNSYVNIGFVYSPRLLYH